jgi:glycosyltransferase involved in cell wall biosynthesis
VRVLLVTTMFPPYCGGGVSAHVRDLSIALTTAGGDVTVLTSRRGKAVDPAEMDRASPSPKVIYSPDFAHMFRRIKKILAADMFDIVHFHSFNSLALSFLGARPRGAAVFTVHCDTANYFASLYGWDRRSHPAYRLLRWYEALAIRTPDATIAVSKRLRAYVESMGAANAVFIPNAVDCDYWTPSDAPHGGGPVILVPRMLVPTSGVEHAILAMRSILGTFPDATMLIAGDGPLRRSLEATAHRVANGSIHFAGEVLRDRMRDLYRAASAVLVPSVTSSGVQDATSIAALEAMACGRPVIASNIGGLPEAIADGRDGLLVPEQSPEAIANAATTLLADDAMARRLGAEARRRVAREFSVARWAERVSRVYALAIDSAGRGG